MGKLSGLQVVKFILLGVFFSSASFASVYDLRGGGHYLDDDIVTYEYNSSSFIPSASDSFNDEFIFTVPEGSIWSFSAVASNWDGMVRSFTEISFQEQLGTVDDFYDGAFIGYVPWMFEMSVLEDQILINPGTYSVFVSGVADMDNAEYGISIALNAVSPVPEPSSIVLMLGGLGLVGFMATRRRKKI